MSFVLVSKDFRNFESSVLSPPSKNMKDITEETRTVYGWTGDSTYRIQFEPQNEIWFSIWVNWANTGWTHTFTIYSPNKNVGLTNNNVTINGSTVKNISRRNGALLPYMFHVKSGISDGVYEVLEDNAVLYSSGDTNILNGESITGISIFNRKDVCYLCDAIVANHAIPCGLKLRSVSATISDLDGWTNTDGTLTSDTAESKFSMTPNADEIAEIERTEVIRGAVPLFDKTNMSSNITRLVSDNGDNLLLNMSGIPLYGKAITNGSQKITVTAKE